MSFPGDGDPEGFDFTPAAPGGYPNDADADTELAAMGFVVGPREVLCPACHLLHPVGAECGW